MNLMKQAIPTEIKTAVYSAYDSLIEPKTNARARRDRQHAVELCCRAIVHSQNGNRVMNADQTISGGVTIRQVVALTSFTLNEKGFFGDE